MAALARRHRLSDEAARRLDLLLDALAAEPDPPTTVVDPDQAVDRHLADSLSGLEVPSLRVARTIADLAGSATVDESHVSEALAFRNELPSGELMNA